MLLSPWSLALNVIALAVLFFVATAARTAVRVLRWWDPGRDDSRQIRLESEIWLTSALLQYSLGFAILSLVLFVLAADALCTVIVGAMCATGTLLANPFGMPALLVKLAGIFFYGYWIVLHRLDVSVETYPLVRAKYRYFLFLLPWLAADVGLQTLYLANLRPDIITSCCGVIFESGTGGTGNLLVDFDPDLVLGLFYGMFVVLVGWGAMLGRFRSRLVRILYGLGWLGFGVVAMVAVIGVFSSYVYAMPYHHCPFCILKPEYHYIGFVLYGTLLPAVFCGTGVGVLQLVRRDELAGVIDGMERRFVHWSIGLGTVFVLLCTGYLAVYRLAGGEI